MKKFNRVLAMLLAIITVLAVLPISVLADDWLNVDADKTTVENVTSTEITVTVDPKALLSYIQDGDVKGLIKGMSATGGLGSIMTKEELLAILPEEKILDLAKTIIGDIDAKALLDCLDADKLLACVDKDGLVSLLTDMDLKSYVKDIDVLMNYVDKGDIEKAIDYIDTDALIDDYSKELMDLALDLAPETLFDIVDLDKAVKLEGIKVEDAANLTYIQTVIGYSTLAEKYVDNAKLDAYVDANLNRFSASIPAYVNKDILADLFDGVEDKLADYVNEDKAMAIVYKALDDGLLTLATLQAYDNFQDALAGGAIAPIYDRLLSGDGTNPAAMDVKVLLFGDATLAPLFPDLAALVNAGVVDVEDLLNNSVISLNELIINKVVDVDKLATVYGYANLVKTDVIKTQITTAINGGVITSADVVACLKDYDAAIDAIGVEEAVAAVGGYMTVIDYVTDLKALVNTFDVMAIAKSILRDRVITDIIDVEGLIKAINVRAFVSKVDIKQLVKVVYESGVAQELLSQLDLEAYMIQAFSIMATMQKTITEIEIDGVVITAQNEEGYIKLLPTKLIDSFENLVPTLNELANIDDSGKLFSASFAISYLDGDVEKTKEINFNFVLTAGTDMIRRAAAKLSALLDKAGYVALTDGKLVAEVRIPSEFASVLRKALEKMADSTDPEMNALKNKVLAVYAAQPDDFIAFAEGLTLEEIVAVLEAVDPALFGKVYGKVLASRYAEVLLSYVERVTGYDFSDNLEAQNLVNTLATIPTFEVFVEKLENVTGFEITDRLPAKVNGYLDHTVYDVIDKLAAVAGYDFDMENLLKAAAASTDPFAYLYTAVVNKVENADAVYSYVQRNTIRVANRLMATRVGNVIADNCLMDFYRGNSTFVFAKTVTFDARAVVEKAFNKVVSIVGSRVSAVEAREEKIAEMFDMALDMIVAETAYMTTGFDVTVKANNIYRVTFQNSDGIVVLDTLLPVGTNLSKMLDYSKYEGAEGWVNVATGDIVNKMPAKDIVVKALVEEEPEETTPEITTPEETTPEETTPEETTPEEPEPPVVPEVEVEGFESLEVVGDNYVITVEKNWNEYANGLQFKLSKVFLTKVQTEGKNLVLVSAVANAQKVTISNAMAATLVSEATGEFVTFSYKFGGVDATSGKETIEFAFDGVNAIADFGEGVQVVLPFAGKSNDNEKTYVYVDGEEGLKAGDGVTVENGTIVFFAPHFSTYTIVNKYRITVDTNTYDENDNLITSSPIAAITGADGWYEAGEVVAITIAKQPLTGYEYVGTKIGGQLFNEGTVNFTMPAASVTAKSYAKASVYNVYYYVNGALAKTQTYTIADYAADKNAFAQTLVSFVPQGFENQNGWEWFGKNAIVNNLGKDISLFWVNDTETKITVSFYVGTELVTSYEKSVAEWRDGELAALKFNIDRVKPGYVWTYTTTGGDVALTDLTLNMLLTSVGGIKFYGTPDDRNYNVYTDGNATADKTDAPAGTEITVTVMSKPGYAAEIKVYKTTDGTTLGDAVTVADGKFTMPASNVIVTVEYTQVIVTYNYITVTVPAGSVLNATDLTTLASAPADMVLYKVERTAEGALKLTYRYTGTFNETAFLAEVNALISAAQYVTTWIVNGVAYNSEVEANNAQLPEGAKIIGWTEMSQNVKVAIIEYTAPQGVSAWVIVCIVLAVLLLLAIIALIYVLHVTGKIGASFITKVCVAIVGVFFAFCMLLAKVALKVLNFMGVKTEDILEELPEEEPVEDIPAVVLDIEPTTEEAPAEEATEETAEEAVEEEAPAEEATEEAAEEAVEEAPAEEATEEAAEEAVEEAPAEEATEETAEEAVEEAPAEEATEETAEEAVEEAPVEEATEETAEEAVEEEAPVEEATEETAEEAVEEAPAEEATEETAEEAVEEAPAEEATEETAEEAVEEAPVEEATEEAAEEAAEEAPVEEATEEAAEEAAEEAPVEEATEETAEEAVEEEAPVEEATEETAEEAVEEEAPVEEVTEEVAPEAVEETPAEEATEEVAEEEKKDE